MPENDLLQIVQAFHSKMDTGFSRLHDRLDEQKNELVKMKSETERHNQKLDGIIANHLDHHPPAEACPSVSVLANHLEDHPNNAKVNEIIKKHEEDHEDKREVLKSVAEWTFRGAILYILAKMGLDKFWSS